MERRGVEAIDLLEVEDQVAQGGGVEHLAHALQQRARGTEEDEAVECEDPNRVSLLSQKAALNRGAVDVAVVACA